MVCNNIVLESGDVDVVFNWSSIVEIRFCAERINRLHLKYKIYQDCPRWMRSKQGADIRIISIVRRSHIDEKWRKRRKPLALYGSTYILNTKNQISSLVYRLCIDWNNFERGHLVPRLTRWVSFNIICGKTCLVANYLPSYGTRLTL